MFPGPRWWQGARSPSPFCQGHAKPWCYEILLERRGLQLNSFEECGIPHTSQPVTMAVNLLQALGRPALRGSETRWQHLETSSGAHVSAPGLSAHEPKEDQPFPDHSPAEPFSS